MVYCRTPHGVRGLKSYLRVLETGHCGRTPHGVRGLKCLVGSHVLNGDRSHPSRGAWIEIVESPHGIRPRVGRTPHGVRGLKYRRPPQDRASE